MKMEVLFLCSGALQKSFEKRIYRKVRPGTAPGDFN